MKALGVPERPLPMTGTAESQRPETFGGVPSGLTRQLTGLSTEVISLVEEELRKAGIDPFTLFARPGVEAQGLGFGERRAGRRVARELGRDTDRLLGEKGKADILAAAERASRIEDPVLRRKFLSEEIAKVKESAGALAEIRLPPESAKIRALTKPGGAEMFRLRRRRLDEEEIR